MDDSNENKSMITSVGEYVEKLESSFIAGGSVNHFGKQFGNFFKTSMTFPYDSAIPLLGVYPREMKKQHMSTYKHTQCS